MFVTFSNRDVQRFLRSAVGANKSANMMMNAIKNIKLHPIPSYMLSTTVIDAPFSSKRIRDIDKKLREWNERAYIVKYSQTMSKRIWKFKATAGATRYFVVKQDLSIFQQRSVALAIYMKVSHAFESLQAGFPFSFLTDSGYSVEDLVSNLLGFYRAVAPGPNYIGLCEPVTAAEAFYVWDTFGAVGSIKNRVFKPYLFPTSPSDKTPVGLAPLPAFLNTILPAHEWDLFFELRGG